MRYCQYSAANSRKVYYQVSRFQKHKNTKTQPTAMPLTNRWRLSEGKQTGFPARPLDGPASLTEEASLNIDEPVYSATFTRPCDCHLPASITVAVAWQRLRKLPQPVTVTYDNIYMHRDGLTAANIDRLIWTNLPDTALRKTPLALFMRNHVKIQRSSSTGNEKWIGYEVCGAAKGETGSPRPKYGV